MAFSTVVVVGGVSITVQKLLEMSAQQGGSLNDIIKWGSNSADNKGFDTTRINLANGPTRFSPSKNAGMQHVLDRHFSPGKNAGQFTITVEKLKSILSRKDIIKTPGTPSTVSGQYTRIVNVGEVVGTIKPSIPEVGGKATTWITIIILKET